MKKLRFLSGLLCSALLLSALPQQAKADNGSINVYNWGQYISDGTDGYIDINKAFTEATGIKVNYMTFDSNESMYTKLKTGGSTYDVLFPSDYMIGKLIEEDMLAELDFANIPNYSYIDEAYKNQSFDPENKYSVPYTWGTVGVIYNDKYVDEEDIGSWELLWNEKYSGKILMFDNPRDAFAIAESMLGFDLNTEYPADLRAAAQKLLEQKPLVQAYVMDQIYDKMEREEAWIAPYYAGDYMMMSEENEHLQYYFPEESFNLFIDAMCVPKNAQNKAGAEAYINFLCDPAISGENMDYLGYSTPETEAKQYMDQETAESPIAYPTASVLERGVSFLNLDVTANQEMDSLWLQVKTMGSLDNYGSVNSIAVWSMTVLLAALIIFLAVRRAQHRRRIARRCARWRRDLPQKS